MDDEARRQKLIVNLEAAIFAAGSIVLVGWLTWVWLPWLMEGKPAGALNLKPLISSSIGTGATGVLLWLGLPGLPIPKSNAQEPERSVTMYSEFLVGISYFLLLGALHTVVALAGFARAQILHRVAPLGNGDMTFSAGTEGCGTETLLDFLIALIQWFSGAGKDDRLITTCIMLLSLGMAIMGALFFCAKRLWDNLDGVQKENPDQRLYFRESIFWAGLWFRLGEAVLFTVGLFLALRFMGNEAIKFLPMLAFVLGISVRSAEALFAGIADRLLGAISGLLTGTGGNRPPTPPGGG